jgi:hypothetical protein
MVEYQTLNVELILYTTHHIYIHTMKVYVVCEHSSFKNVDMVAIQSLDPQARILNRPILSQNYYILSVRNNEEAMEIQSACTGL